MQDFIVFHNGVPARIVSDRDSMAALMDETTATTAPGTVSVRELGECVLDMDRASTAAGLPFSLVVQAATGACAKIDAEGRIWTPLDPATILKVARSWHGV